MNQKNKIATNQKRKGITKSEPVLVDERYESIYYPGEKMMKDLGCTREKCMEHIAELENVGLMKVVDLEKGLFKVKRI